ncbi:MAG: aminotransferase class I/II-fold pyridoxal phosphate-dependent enzyme, partial [Clostridia bacterium]
ILTGCQLFGMSLVTIDNCALAQQNFERDKDIAGIVVTSPDYFGMVVDLEDIQKVCKALNKLLIVDSAHGAHFAYSNLLPQSVSEVADLTSVSMHKTMNAYGGGALLNVGNENLYEYALYYRNILHSTSPSYLVLASMDSARDDFEQNGQRYYEEVLASVQDFDCVLKQKMQCEVELLKTDDFSRVVIDLRGKDGYDAQSQLLANGVGIEMAYYDKLVAIVNPFNCKSLDLLANALTKIQFKKLAIDIPKWTGKRSKYFNQQSVLTAVGGESELDQQGKLTAVGKPKIEFVDVDDAIGRVSACDIGIYPPSVAIVKSGDILDSAAIKIIKELGNKVFGLVNNRIVVIY